jgi:hypothetical protein
MIGGWVPASSLRSLSSPSTRPAVIIYPNKAMAEMKIKIDLNIKI